MTKKTLPVLFALIFGFGAFTSCEKSSKTVTDPTKNFFPISLGKYIVYQVDSSIYDNVDTLTRETRTQIKYTISDTFRDASNRLAYTMDVYTRPYDGAVWSKSRVITLTPYDLPMTTTNPPAGTPTTGIMWNESGVIFTKVVFPMANNISWYGNNAIDTRDADLAYYANWNYTYKDIYKSYNNGYVNYPNTITCIENDESVNYPNIDSALNAYRIYSKSVYGMNIGLVYREYTHWTYDPSVALKVLKGYSVVMRAIDHN